MAIGWPGEKVRLVPLEFERHFENCYRWINDADVSEWLALGDLPMSRLAEKEWFEKAQVATETQIHFAIETLDGRHVGNSGLFRISRAHGTAMSGSLIGEFEDRGKGLGTDATKVRAWYGFHVLGLRQLYSEYFGGNEPAKRMQEKVGYVEWGVRPAAFWKRGAYRDLVETVLTRERFFELHPEWAGRSG